MSDKRANDMLNQSTVQPSGKVSSDWLDTETAVHEELLLSSAKQVSVLSEERVKKKIQSLVTTATDLNGTIICLVCSSDHPFSG